MYRYIGNKKKLLPYIMASTQEMIGKTGTVVDLMAGTGLVAAEYRKMGYAVIASDMMTYSKRSEERRVGKECRIGCRSRWSPYH